MPYVRDTLTVANVDIERSSTALLRRAIKLIRKMLSMAAHHARVRTRNILILLLTVYAVSRVLQLCAGRVPTLLIVILHVVPPALFALIHGRITYGTRGILIFTVLCLGVGTLLESLSLRTGFPFGHYYFTGLMGPKLFQLPILLALAYLGMGYLSWIVANVILGRHPLPPRGIQIILLPAIASFIMVAWDLAMDPVWTYIDGAWVWLDGGPYFGVPISNFFGWLLTVYIFYQAFALYLRARPAAHPPRRYRCLAVLFYTTSAAGNLLLALPSPHPSIVTDPSGRQWLASDIIVNCVLVSIFVMGAFAAIAWSRLLETPFTRPS